MRSLLALPLLLALACGEERPPTPPAPEAPAAEPTDEDEALLDEELLEDDAPPSLGESELDAMSEPELEAACFQGSTGACDRLGHWRSPR